MGETKNSYGILEKKRMKGNTACRWVENIKMDLREIGWKSMDCIHLASDMDHWAILLKALLKAVKLYRFMWKTQD
jgi:hypothetical protein